MQSYDEYLAEVKFEEIKLTELTTEKLEGLETKEGVVIVSEGHLELYLMRKFEPMKILNTVAVFEKVDEFIIIDPFRMTMFAGTSEEVIEFTEGFYSDDEI